MNASSSAMCPKGHYAIGFQFKTGLSVVYDLGLVCHDKQIYYTSLNIYGHWRPVVYNSDEYFCNIKACLNTGDVVKFMFGFCDGPKKKELTEMQKFEAKVQRIQSEKRKEKGGSRKAKICCKSTKDQK